MQVARGESDVMVEDARKLLQGSGLTGKVTPEIKVLNKYEIIKKHFPPGEHQGQSGKIIQSLEPEPRARASGGRRCARVARIHISRKDSSAPRTEIVVVGRWSLVVALLERKCGRWSLLSFVRNSNAVN